MAVKECDRPKNEMQSLREAAAFFCQAVAEFAGEIVYLERVGYWLTRKPRLPAG